MIRRQRPDRELVHDEVEDALKSEFNDLHYISHQLEAKLKAVNKEIAHLQMTAAQLELNIEDKVAALNMDSSVLKLSPGPPSMASRATSTRSMTLEKINALEASLAETGQSRIKLEKELEDMKREAGLE